MTAALIDVHVHLYPDQLAGQEAKDGYVIWEYGDDPGVEFSTVGGDLDDLAAVYGQAGFDRAVVVHLFDTAAARAQAWSRLAPEAPAAPTLGVLPAPGAVPPAGAAAVSAWAAVEEAVGQAMQASNRWVAGVARSNPLVEVLVCVDPTLFTPSQLVAHLTELADQGVRGIKLHPVSQGYRPDDARLQPIYQTCQEAGLVVLSHSGPGHHGDASARPREFGPVLERWPELRLVLAHLGGAAWRETAELATMFPQVVFDLSEIIEWAGAANAPSAAELAGLIQGIGADRVMLGSDFPWYDPRRTVDRVMGLPSLGPAEREAILGGTAMRVLRLDRPTATAN